MRSRSIVIALAGALVLSACADSSTDESAPDDTTGETSAATTAPAGTGTPGDLGAIAEIQTTIEGLSDAISESESAQELNSAWNTLETALAATVASFRANGAIAREEVEAALDAFQQELDELDVEENVRTAFDELRAKLEALATG